MNTAGRLLAIFDRLIARGRAEASMAKVWAEIFEIQPDSLHMEDDVVNCLQATRLELQLMRTKLMGMGAPEELLYPGFKRLLNVTSAAHINAGWSGFWEEASKPENRLVLAWADWTLREENELDMSADDLAALRDDLSSLEAGLQEADMTPYLRGFVQRQIDIIRLALRVYRIQGVKPVEQALNQIVGACTTEKMRLEVEHGNAKEAAKTVLSRMASFIDKTAKVADSVDKIRKVGESAHSLAVSVGPALLTFVRAL